MLKVHEKFFLAGLVCVVIGLIGQCLVVWIECDRATFGPKGDGAEVVRDMFGQGVTPALVAARLNQALRFLSLFTFAMVLGVVGSLQVVRILNARVEFNPFEENE